MTVTTTHGFCQLVLAGLGSAGDLDVGATLLEDPDDLLEEVVADLYLRRAEWDHARPPFGFAAARAAAAAAVANPDALLVPDPAEGYLLSRLAHGARKGLAERLQDANLLTYDHVLTRLAATLGDPARGAAACARLQQRYQVVLVDEFQDTDPVQWEVLRRAFGTGDTTLVLIGDPKQAIYAFRGADVHAYLAAHRQARRFTLGANWRADQPLLDAIDALLSPLQLGHPAIRFRPVEAPAAHCRAGLLDAPVSVPLRVRLVPDRHAELPRTPASTVRPSP
ncbi:AAA family ATPase [Acidimicrobiaceae bacterium USS-CC1]|uniref:AAA family ATPase n=1 Tax=Acidiferrimicrobium australe TaxID=2664430 RepID=A0ABW9QZP1_9ACTN|nr:AAA family ATPase [Acidiferrimicrobium australe]